jgi:hypothetical protein
VAATLHYAIALPRRPIQGDRLLLEGGRTLRKPSVNKSLTLRGGYSGCGSGSTAYTTLDGGGSSRVLGLWQPDCHPENLNIVHGNEAGEAGWVSRTLSCTEQTLKLQQHGYRYGGGVRLWAHRHIYQHQYP